MLNIYYILILVILIGVSFYFYLKNSYLQKVNNFYAESLLKNIPLGLYYKDLKGDILFFNNMFAKIIGHTDDELKNKNIKEIYPEEYIEKMAQDDEKVIKNRETLYIERLITSKNGETHCYGMLKSPVFNKKNNIKGFIILFKNIDTDKEVEERKQSFISTLIHDLKTPSNAQINMLSLLLDGQFGVLNDKQREMISLTRCSSEYVFDLVAIILDTYLYNSGNVIIKPDFFNIVELITALCKGAEYSASEKNQKIKFFHSTDNCIVYADRLQIKRVIVNLLSNSTTYAYPNTDIIIKLICNDENIEVIIQNKSKQIPEEDLKDIFSKYKKTQLSRYNKISTGLGLYLSKKIINMHNGEIYAKSFEDDTCIFGFKLPVKKDTVIHSCMQ